MRYRDNEATGCLIFVAASVVVGLIALAVCGGAWLYFYDALIHAK